jgi:hypothetical protein
MPSTSDTPPWGPGGAGAGGGAIRPPRPGGGAGGSVGVIDDVNDFLGSVTGGLWPIGDGLPGPARPAGSAGKEADRRPRERVGAYFVVVFGVLGGVKGGVY